MALLRVSLSTISFGMEEVESSQEEVISSTCDETGEKTYKRELEDKESSFSLNSFSVKLKCDGDQTSNLNSEVNSI